MTDEETACDHPAESTILESTAQTNTTHRIGALRPLQVEGRYREPRVETQIEGLQRCSRGEFWRRVEQREAGSAEAVQPETLVYLLRERHRSGDSDAAWRIAEALMAQCAGYIARQVACWRSLSTAQQEECIRDAQIRMLQDVFNEGSGCEFWEVRFWFCLKRRTLNIVQKYRTVAEGEFQPEPMEDEAGRAKDFFENVPDVPGVSVETGAQIGEALALLTDQERAAFILYHYEGWAQEHIAAQLGVVDRTVRNWLTRAENKLAQWRQDNLH